MFLSGAEREIEASDMTALEAVMSVNEEKTRLEAKAEKLNTLEGPEVEQLLIDIYERCAPPFPPGKYSLKAYRRSSYDRGRRGGEPLIRRGAGRLSKVVLSAAEALINKCVASLS